MRKSEPVRLKLPPNAILMEKLFVVISLSCGDRMSFRSQCAVTVTGGTVENGVSKTILQ
jgi:hypothetical protein